MSEQSSITPDPSTVMEIAEMGLAAWAREKASECHNDYQERLEWAALADAAEALERKLRVAEMQNFDHESAVGCLEKDVARLERRAKLAEKAAEVLSGGEFAAGCLGCRVMNCPNFGDDRTCLDVVKQWAYREAEKLLAADSTPGDAEGDKPDV